MSNGTVILCGHCNRPVIVGVGMSVVAGGRLYHYECARSPYANISETYKPTEQAHGIGVDDDSTN